VHGPKRGQLTKGQSVTVRVKVDDQFVERVVQPEECVGESETPMVSNLDQCPHTLSNSSRYLVCRQSWF
jgi:hypothetical protein